MIQLFFILFNLLCSTSLMADTLTFKRDGKALFSVSSQDWEKGKFSTKKFDDIKPIERKVYNVFREFNRTYEGYSFRAVLDAIYGPLWRTSKIIVFGAKDGFKKGTKTKMITKTFKDHQGILAFTEKGKKGFTKIKKKNKEIDPGDFYLVWAGFKPGHVNMESQKDLQWPYQLKEIDIKF